MNEEEDFMTDALLGIFLLALFAVVGIVCWGLVEWLT